MIYRDCEPSAELERAIRYGDNRTLARLVLANADALPEPAYVREWMQRVVSGARTQVPRQRGRVGAAGNPVDIAIGRVLAALPTVRGLQPELLAWLAEGLLRALAGERRCWPDARGCRGWAPTTDWEEAVLAFSETHVAAHALLDLPGDDEHTYKIVMRYRR